MSNYPAEKKEPVAYASSIFEPLRDENYIKFTSNGISTIQIVIKAGDQISFVGRGLLQVLSGSVELFGYTINCCKSLASYPIYSPKSTSLFVIKKGEINDPNRISHSSKINLLLKYTSADSIIQITSLSDFDNFECLSHLLTDLMYESVNEDHSLKGFYLIFKPIPNLNTFNAFSEWTFFGKSLENFNSVPTILVYGSRKVGKSTFCRWLTNILLNKNSQVAFLNLDCGQTEFTPPGILSLNIISTPLLGPPFTHHTIPEKSFFYGSIDVSADPSCYLKIVNSLFVHYIDNYYNLGIPLVVNTIGWITGLGLNLLRHHLSQFKFTHVVCIEEFGRKNNLSLESMESKIPFLHISIDPHNQMKEKPLFTTITSPITICNKTTPFTLRYLSFITYFYGLRANSNCDQYKEQNMQFEKNQFCTYFYKKFSEILPFQVSWSSIAFKYPFEQVSIQHTMNAMNMTIVGLCHDPHFSSRIAKSQTDKFSIIFSTAPLDQLDCVGIGFVRGIDTEKQKLYIISPLSCEQIQRVNVIVRGNFDAPTILIEAETHLPYVSQCRSNEMYGYMKRKVRHNIARKRE